MIELEEKLHYIFHDKNLLKEALTHPSVKRLSRSNLSYERLEFLGDKVLGLIIADALVNQFKGENEGELSKRHASLVCKHSLAFVANSLNLGKFVILSKGQIMDGGRDNENILENTMEAIIGAIFLDGGIEKAKNFVLKHFEHLLINTNYLNPPQDPKSAFQEWFQRKYKKLPEYELISSFNNEFVVKLALEGFEFQAKAKSIKEAQKNVANQALCCELLMKKLWF